VLLARVGFGPDAARFDFSQTPERKGRILAVVGAGHLDGIVRVLQAGGVSEDRLMEISSSSKQSSTWPGRGVLQVVNVPK
jgi:pheromone shutdown protein TraB